jgi:hypothetical protein
MARLGVFAAVEKAGFEQGSRPTSRSTDDRGFRHIAKAKIHVNHAALLTLRSA